MLCTFINKLCNFEVNLLKENKIYKNKKNWIILLEPKIKPPETIYTLIYHITLWVEEKSYLEDQFKKKTNWKRR